MSSKDDSSQTPACYGCEDHAIERLAQMFVDLVQKKRIQAGQNPAERPVFRKLHGVAHGRLEIAPNLPADLKIGLFAHSVLPAWVRFSSDTAPASSDLTTTVGIGIKLFDVPGPKLLGEEGNTADLILQNFPVFFVDDAQSMCEFTYAGVVLNDYPGYLAEHQVTNEILKKMARIEGSVLTTTYWSILPFGFGPGRYVKFRLDPETMPQNVACDDPNYLATDLCNRLRVAEAKFRLMVQFRTNPEGMPLDKATVEWDSPFTHVATLVLPVQDVTERGQAEYGQNLSFNIWRVPPDHEPQGSIAKVRKVVYAMSADVRRQANGQSCEEAASPRRLGVPKPAPDSCIVGAVIHPSIGVARVGTSPEEFFIGPETPDPPAQKPGFYRDAKGALKRQAARFRIYGVNAAGTIVRELTPGDAEIEWTVHLANQKAAWHGFQLALDIPEAASAPPTVLRNAAVADRERLVIDPGPRSIGGCFTGPEGCRFDTGEFMGKRVYLGELRTDEAGRLIVLGGRGHSASCDGSRAITFANNEGWHDDVSDGPVTARVKFEGRELRVTPSWVVVAPPNYGPMRKSVRTMWDLMRDVAIQAGMLADPGIPSFSKEILPIFERLSGLQWVNAGFAAAFGWQGPFNMTDPAMLERLSKNSPAYQALRRVIYDQFRDNMVDSWSPVPWPWNYGDAMNIPPAPTPRQNSALSGTQMRLLERWVMGEFIEDYDPTWRGPQSVEDVPVANQGEVLDRAALEFCLADAFHPGCEMTWPVRAKTIYMAPFRFAHAPRGWIEPALGESINSDSVTIPNGPLGGQVPGGITRWMAVPWQTDTASCRSGYDTTYDPYVPSFWPARVPNQVLSKENYQIVMDPRKPVAERLQAFANRADWIAPLGATSYTEQINNMIAHFDHLGVVEQHPGPADTSHFPKIMEVEDRHRLIHDVPLGQDQIHGHGPEKQAHAQADLKSIEKVHRFPQGLRSSAQP